MTSFAWDIFISFGWHNEERAIEIADGLKPLRVFVAQRHLHLPHGVETPDAEIAERLTDALRASKTLLVLWGQDSAVSDWCRFELSTFRVVRPGASIFMHGLDGLELSEERGQGAVIVDDLGELREQWEELTATRPEVVPEIAEEQTRAPIFELLVAPTRWAARQRRLPRNFALADLWTDPDPDARRTALRTIAGAVALNIVVLMLCALGTLIYGGASERLAHHLTLAATVSIVGGTILMIGHGVGAGAAAIAWSGLSGYPLTVMAALGQADAPGAVTAATMGALIGACAAYRVQLSPRAGVQTPLPPRWKWSTAVRLLLGLLLAALLIRWGLRSLREEYPILLLQYVLGGHEVADEDLRTRLIWTVFPRDMRALFGALIGLTAGLGTALMIGQRFAIIVRPRHEKMRAILGSGIAMIAMIAAGGTIGLLEEIPPASLIEGLVIGLLLALIVPSLYLFPPLFAGLKITEPAKSLWGLFGAAILLVYSRQHLEVLTGVRDQLDAAFLRIYVSLAASFVGSWALTTIGTAVAIRLIRERRVRATGVDVAPPLDQRSWRVVLIASASLHFAVLGLAVSETGRLDALDAGPATEQLRWIEERAVAFGEARSATITTVPHFANTETSVHENASAPVETDAADEPTTGTQAAATDETPSDAENLDEKTEVATDTTANEEAESLGETARSTKTPALDEVASSSNAVALDDATSTASSSEVALAFAETDSVDGAIASTVGNGSSPTGGDSGFGVVSSETTTLRVQAYIDGRSVFVIQGGDVRWHHEAWAAPGRHAGHDLPTYLNGAAWMPSWPAGGEVRDCHCASGRAPAPVPVEGAVSVACGSARGGVSIRSQPSPANGLRIEVVFDDGAPGGAAWYDCTISYQSAVQLRSSL